jgi:hypothetical protein
MPTLFNIHTSMNLGTYLVLGGSAPMGTELKLLSKNARDYQEEGSNSYVTTTMDMLRTSLDIWFIVAYTIHHQYFDKFRAFFSPKERKYTKYDI